MIDPAAAQPVSFTQVFSAVPDVLEQLSKYVALEQRLAVKGATFERNDFAIQIHLEQVGAQEDVLRALGSRLIDLGRTATGHLFDHASRSNVENLARVAARRNLK